jgi:hypothetical protein
LELNLYLLYDLTVVVAPVALLIDGEERLMNRTVGLSVRIAMLVLALCLLGGGLRVAVAPVAAGFTPTPEPPPTATPVPPTPQPERPPTEDQPAPTPMATPLPEPTPVIALMPVTGPFSAASFLLWSGALLATAVLLGSWLLARRRPR